MCALASRIAGTFAQSTTLKFEAENGVLSGTTVDSVQSGYSGSGYVTGFDTAGDKITFNVAIDATALYDIGIHYAGIYGEKKTTLVLNSGSSNEISLPATSTWATASGGQLLLTAGDNVLEIISNWGWYLVDYITLTPAEGRPPHQITTELVNDESGPTAYKLYNYLISLYGKKILSGQQDLKWANWINDTIGKTPALLSVDLMDYSPSRVERQGDISTAVEDAIAHHEKGGIVSVLWHWNAPIGLYDTSENPWWSGFYTRATDFDVAEALANPSSANYTLLLRDIDAIAIQLKRLEAAGVSVLFRPLHEAEGGWFWWGAEGPDAAKALWGLVFDRLGEYHGLSNLIWVWNSIAEDWYPGDDLVDIVSADVYAQGHGVMSTQYQQLLKLGNDTKLIAAAEVGSAPMPDMLQAYGADWLWFCVWGDSYINNDDWNSIEVLKEIYNSEYVLTLDEIQGWATS
ncbi:GH26 endo-beta-1,4-mannanase [Microdochium trichocladiopsis]|uniref:GH26 endo-beta-1,4-mannanase n=1 Tax=Microdochium trichocladiopsis TaxID=1682393 RepID=A0A9P8Y2I8_9PEZI|nr:GH26 endo-beta-1,4-mannanase [Microdochium trichocladiopsis]KAH7026369.1 GH26 endo-beta-1,4-mannanase [Microdochium trichocladiopsis]